MVFGVLALSIVLLLGFYRLGGFVMRHQPLRIDAVLERAFFGHAKAAAAYFTILGYAPALSVLLGLCVLSAILLHRPVMGVLLLIVLQLFSQSVCNTFKQHFRRTRPTRWHRYLEPTAAYPSGHSATAVLVFGGLIYLMMQTSGNDLVKLALVFASIATALGIAWSRLALGAHHFTDICGGAMLGGATLSLFIATLMVN